jgi:hypothetical protein
MSSRFEVTVFVKAPFLEFGNRAASSSPQFIPGMLGQFRLQTSFQTSLDYLFDQPVAAVDFIIEVEDRASGSGAHSSTVPCIR